MSASFENQFQELKQQFIARSRDRLTSIESLLEQLFYRPEDVLVLRQIMTHFHWLAGSGGTYGFDEITQWGTYGEELCEYLLKLQAPVKQEDQEKLLSAYQTVQLLFAASAPPAQKTTAEINVSKVSSTTELLVPPGALLPGNIAAGAAYNSSNPSSSGMGNAANNFSSGGNLSSNPASIPGSNSERSAADLRAEFLGSTLSSSSKPTQEIKKDYQADSQKEHQAGEGSFSNARDRRAYTDQPSYSNPNASFPGTSAPGSSYSSSSGAGSAGAGSSVSGSSFQSSAPANSTPLDPQMASTGRPGGGFSAPPLTSGAVIQQPPEHSFAAGARYTGEVAVPRLMHVAANQSLAIMLDANTANLGMLKSSLEQQGIHVELFNSTSVVRSIFSERLPDFLIISVPLPDGDGYELVEYLRTLDGGHRPTVFILGQQAGFLDKVLAIRAGADAFFEYPAEHQEVLQKLQSLTVRDRVETYKILSVEDDQNQADFIKLTLETAGYQVLHISDPKRFEDTFLSFEPDLVLLDVMLGDMTGFELAKYIRQHDRFAALPIVFLTTQNKLHQHIRSAIAGGDEHLVKPVAPQLLIATIASRLEKSRSLKRLIDRDGLTKCLNYGTFMERAQRLTLPELYRNSPSLMMIDIDNMKQVNEQFGYASGDRVITSISNVLLKGFRNTDMIARFGNDQFAIVLEHLTDVQLQALASQVLSAICNTPQMIGGRTVSVTCSCGVAALEPGMALPQWIAEAELALRKAKESGKNRAIVKPSNRGTSF